MNLSYGVSDVAGDVLQAYRSFTHKGHRLVTATIVLIVALGVGTATLVFSIVDALLIDRLPFPAPDQLVDIELTTQHERSTQLFGRAADVALYQAWRRETTDAIELAGFQVNEGTLSGYSNARTVQVVGITSNTIELLGTSPLYGHDFAGSDDARGVDAYG